MREVVLIPLGILTGIAVIFGALYLRTLLIIKDRTNVALNLVKRHKILLMEKAANFFGQASKGPKQFRGNGILIFTDKGLFFEMWTPKKSLKIPISSIIGAEKANRFLDKTNLKPLLKVRFFNKSGIEDSAAWLVKDPEKWIFRINKVIKSL